jgi:acyl-coenzyme A synthetase/AMP-(fatty) acid ligase
MVRFVEVLPKTAVGKIQKTAIRELYWAERDRRI